VGGRFLRFAGSLLDARCEPFGDGVRADAAVCNLCERSWSHLGLILAGSPWSSGSHLLSPTAGYRLHAEAAVRLSGRGLVLPRAGASRRTAACRGKAAVNAGRCISIKALFREAGGSEAVVSVPVHLESNQ
jgi:hypothetical protein